MDVKSTRGKAFRLLDVATEEGGKKMVATKFVVDCTGYSLKFVKLNQGRKPSLHAACGIECIRRKMRSMLRGCFSWTFATVTCKRVVTIVMSAIPNLLLSV